MGNAESETSETGTLIEVIKRALPLLSRSLGKVGLQLIADTDVFLHRSISEIARQSRVSEPTILRFCRHFGYNSIHDFRIALAKSLVLETTEPRLSRFEPLINDRQRANEKQKIAIANRAVSLLGDARSIIIDSGSTTQFLAEQLREHRPLNIFTTGLNIVEALRGPNRHTVILSGGTVHFESQSLNGRLVEQSIGSLHFDILFMGADSIDIERGISTFRQEEVNQNELMMRASSRTIVLADSSKFGFPGLRQICKLSQIDTIVTDSGLTRETAQQFEKQGINLEIVNY